MNIEEILVGWREIMPAFGVRSVKTMKKKVRKYGIPILRVARKPTISMDEITGWRESRKQSLCCKRGETHEKDGYNFSINGSYISMFNG